MVDATRFWVHGCEPGRVSDGSRLALCQMLLYRMPEACVFCYSCSFSLSFLCVCVFPLLSLELGIDVPLIFFCPADHVPDWQCILLDMVEARSVNVKKTTTLHHSTIRFFRCYQLPPEVFGESSSVRVTEVDPKGIAKKYQIKILTLDCLLIIKLPLLPKWYRASVLVRPTLNRQMR